MCKYTHIYVCACVYIWVYIYLYILLMEIKLAQIRENTQDSLNKQKVFLFVPALHELVSSEKVMELQTQNCIHYFLIFTKRIEKYLHANNYRLFCPRYSRNQWKCPYMR